MIEPKLPEVTFNKSGYEIRANLLEHARAILLDEFRYKMQGWELSVEKDKDGKIVTKVEMPEFPGVDKILETAEKLYSFVNQKTVTKK